MDAIALKALFDTLESFGPGVVLLALLAYLVWRGEVARARKTGGIEAGFIKAMEALTKSNNKLATNFDQNIRTVEAIQGHMDEIKATLHRLSELAAEIKGGMK